MRHVLPVFDGLPAPAAYNQPFMHPLVVDTRTMPRLYALRAEGRVSLVPFCRDARGQPSKCKVDIYNISRTDFYAPYGNKGTSYYGLDLVRAFRFAALEPNPKRNLNIQQPTLVP